MKMCLDYDFVLICLFFLNDVCRMELFSSTQSLFRIILRVYMDFPLSTSVLNRSFCILNFSHFLASAASTFNVFSCLTITCFDYLLTLSYICVLTSKPNWGAYYLTLIAIMISFVERSDMLQTEKFVTIQ